MENATSIFKFVTLRNPQDSTVIDDLLNIQPRTQWVNSLIAINESGEASAKLVSAMNSALQSFIDGKQFLKTKQSVAVLTAASDEQVLEILYNNIVVRLLTKSNTNPVYKALVERAKTVYKRINQKTLANIPLTRLRIILPEGLNFSFTGFVAPKPITPTPKGEITAMTTLLQEYTALKSLLKEAKAEHVIRFDKGNSVIIRNTKYSSVNTLLGVNSIRLEDAAAEVESKLQTATAQAKNEEQQPNASQRQQRPPAPDGKIEEPPQQMRMAEADVVLYNRMKTLLNEAKAEGVTTLDETQQVERPEYAPILKSLSKTSVTFQEAEKLVGKKLAELSKQAIKLVPMQKYSLIGSRWLATSAIEATLENTTPKGEQSPTGEQAIIVHSNGCHLKFPFMVADLRVVEQQTVGYLPGEIAHINNTQPGEKNTRVTRRLKRLESFESLITESEVFRETDTTSTEKFSMELGASEVETEENSWNVNASVKGTYGLVTASVDGGYDSSTSSTNSNSSAQTYAKDIVERVVERVSNKVRIERSLKTLEEFEETVTHEIDNTKGADPKSYVYRWMNKLSRATLKNYGKRLMFQIDVAHPAHYYLSRSIKPQSTSAQIEIPSDPRDIEEIAFKADTITRDNYLDWGDLYQVKLDSPPVEIQIVSYSKAATDGDHAESTLIAIPKGYRCKKASIIFTQRPLGSSHIKVLIGRNGLIEVGPQGENWLYERDLHDEMDNLPFSLWQANSGYSLNIEVKCELTDEAFSAWQIKTYYALVEGYESLKAEAEGKMTEFNPNAPGLHPMKKMEFIRTELKKEALRRMFRCNPFWVNDKYEVSTEYQPDCCNDGQYAEKVRFLETVFDWKNMTYVLHPYFYADKDNWADLLDLSDDDPHFEAFLQASYATIRVPVHRDALKETAAVNFIINNSIANYEVVPENMQNLLDELSMETATPFTYDLNGDPLPLPKKTIDLGIFNLPTSLVILECGTMDGVKPIGFPQSAEVPTDVVIPRQYSPAIIADTCKP